ncbi:chemotaxis protein CheW [uncultured Desulfuromonas sp.]|uniref:chemotaxis protein CheW n=1 Tax=uncultured Desulfuromonas sp. TaxID=181013 RepID=UPI002626BF9D|nr:chemotaxis protein CheW [uncultured Desulfuromonas sp.]
MNQVLVFRQGGALYGLEVTDIQELVEAPPLYYIPRAAGHYSGAINFHGNVVPVLDLGVWLARPGQGRDHRVIVLSLQLGALALAVEAVQRIVPLDAEALQPASEERSEGRFIRAVFVREEQPINLLDPAKLIAGLEQA